jgi:hypothetical protein
VDYYQGVVIDYLRANRAVFVNSECCIQLNAGQNPDSSGPHWFCDAVAVDFEKHGIFLCEISYAKALGAFNEETRHMEPVLGPKSKTLWYGIAT